MTAALREHEDALDRDPLAARLARIADPPVPDGLTARIVADASARRFRPARRTTLRALVLLAAVLAGAIAVSAMATPMRGYMGQLLVQMGLEPARHDLAAVTAGGQTIRVTSGVDDGWVVMLGVRAEPGHGSAIRELAATDADGRPLESLAWAGNETDGGDEVLAFFRRPADGAPPGTPLTLHVRPADSVGGPGWTLRLTVPASPMPAEVPAPEGGRMAGVDVTFPEVRASARYIVVVVEATGPTERDVIQTIGPTSLADPGGQHVPNMIGLGGVPEAAAGGVREREELYWPRQGSGAYRLTVGPYQGQQIRRTIEVR